MTRDYTNRPEVTAAPPTADAEAALELLPKAAACFQDSGQPLDEERCHALAENVA